MFFYTDLSDESHPLNYTHGSLDDCDARPTAFWARKMRKVFRKLDTEQKGQLMYLVCSVEEFYALKEEIANILYISFRLTAHQIPIVHEENALTSLPRPYYTHYRNNGWVSLESHSAFMPVSHPGVVHTH